MLATGKGTRRGVPLSLPSGSICSNRAERHGAVMKAESGRRSDGRETALDSEVEAIKDGGGVCEPASELGPLGFCSVGRKIKPPK